MPTLPAFANHFCKKSSEPLELRRQGGEAFACLLRSSPVNSLAYVQGAFWEKIGSFSLRERAKNVQSSQGILHMHEE